jgi:hypothetical protein
MIIAITEDAVKALSAEVEIVVRGMRPLIAGRDPAVQGAVISHLLAVYLKGYAGPDIETMRAELCDNIARTALKLIPILEAEEALDAPLH